MRATGLAFLLLLGAGSLPVHAQSAAAPTASSADAQSVAALVKKLEAAERYMAGLRAEIDALQAKGAAGGLVPAAEPTEAATAPTPEPPPSPPIARAAPLPDAGPLAANGERDPDRGPSPEQDVPVFTPAFLRQAQAVLIPRNRLEVEPRIQYVFQDDNLLNLAGLDLVETVFIGTIDVSKRRRHAFSGILSGRYGLTDRLQASANIPYRYVYDSVILPEAVQRVTPSSPEEINQGHDIGDIEFGLAYHAIREKGWLPDLILGLSAKSNTGQGPFGSGPDVTVTGTGFWGVRGLATVVKVTDPGVLFGSASYLLHLEDGVGSGTTIDPGDVFTLSGGYGFALNPFFSLSTRLEVNYLEQLQVNGSYVNGSDSLLATMAFGLTYGIGRRTAIDLTAEFGLTEATPDFRFSLGMPLQFILPNWDRNLFKHLRRKK